MQASALPVVYMLLTAEDKGAQTAAVKMLTFLCQVGSDWREQEQVAIAKFGDGAILVDLVERVQSVCHQRKLSPAKALELGSLLQLLSAATAGLHLV